MSEPPEQVVMLTPKAAAPPPLSPPAALPPPLLWNSTYGNWAQIASAMIAFLGFGIIIFQLWLGQHKSEVEAYRAELGDARRNYNSYSEALLRYPNLGTPDFTALMHDHKEFLRYKSFVSHMLYAYDDVLNVVKDSTEPGAFDEWKIAFVSDLRDHRRYICQLSDPEFFGMYRPRIKQLVDAAIGKCTAAEMEPLKELPPEPVSSLSHLVPH